MSLAGLLANSETLRRIGSVFGTGAGAGALYGALSRTLPGESRSMRILTSALAGLGGNVMLNMPGIGTPTTGLVTAGAIKGLLSPKVKDESHSRLKNVARGTAKGVAVGGLINLGDYVSNRLQTGPDRKVHNAILNAQKYYFLTGSDRQKLKNMLGRYAEASKGLSELGRIGTKTLVGTGLGALYGGVTEKLPGESRLRRVLTSALAGGVGGASHGLNKRIGGQNLAEAMTGAMIGSTKGILNPVDNTKSTGGRIKERAKNTALGGLKGGIIGDVANIAGLPRMFSAVTEYNSSSRAFKDADKTNRLELAEVLKKFR